MQTKPLDKRNFLVDIAGGCCRTGLTVTNRLWSRYVKEEILRICTSCGNEYYDEVDVFDSDDVMDEGFQASIFCEKCFAGLGYEDDDGHPDKYLLLPNGWYY